MPVVNFGVDMKAVATVDPQAPVPVSPITLEAAARADRARPNVAGGFLDLRIRRAPAKEGIPAGTYLWAVVETFPNRHEEILLGSFASSIIEAAAQGSLHFERISKERGQ